MTRYPINLSYDRHDGLIHEGFAATAQDAGKKVQDNRGRNWTILTADLATCEVGSLARSRAECERAWADEIAAGWMSCLHVSGGWRGEATFWVTTELEDDEKDTTKTAGTGRMRPNH